MEIGLFITYLIKASIYISLFYTTNKIFLKNVTQHQSSRRIWLFSVIVAIILPLISVLSISLSVDTNNFINFTSTTNSQPLNNDISSNTNNSEVLFTTTNIIFALFIIYILGAATSLISKAILYIKLLNLIKRFDCSKHYSTQKVKELCHKFDITQKIKLRECKFIQSPMSWGNYIVLDEDKEAMDSVIIHELAHIKYRHSLDIIFLDVLSIIFWFNPLIGQIKQQLQQIHEYQADEFVLKTGANIKEYQLLLIRKAAGSQSHSIANSFNHSNLKKRITMMLKTKSSRWAALKALYALPFVMVVATVYANDSVSDSFNHISEVKINEIYGTIQKDTTTAKQKSKEVKVIGYGTKKDAQNPIKYTKGNSESEVLIIVNNKIYDGKIKDIDPETISSISVLKGNNEDPTESKAVKFAKETIANINKSDLKKAEKGVIVISLK